ncbi:hypothetical protein MRX96_049019 [Rhipicephalus microplus]
MPRHFPATYTCPSTAAPRLPASPSLAFCRRAACCTTQPHSAFSSHAAKVDSAGDTCKTSAVSRGSTPRNDVQCPSAMSAASSGRPVPLPRGFLSCHGLPLDDARGDLGRSSRSLAADGPSWPPILAS